MMFIMITKLRTKKKNLQKCAIGLKPDLFTRVVSAAVLTVWRVCVERWDDWRVWSVSVLRMREFEDLQVLNDVIFFFFSLKRNLKEEQTAPETVNKYFWREAMPVRGHKGALCVADRFVKATRLGREVLNDLSDVRRLRFESAHLLS